MDAWKQKTIIFLSSQTLSLFGSSLVQYAILWHITLTTQSGTMMTLSVVFGTLPTFFLSPFAGVWADRYNRKRLIMASDAGIAVTTLILAILFAGGYRMIWLLFVASAIRAVGSAIQMPAVGAFLPQIVPAEHLMKVNGFNGSIQSAVMLLSPILSGLLLSFSDIVSIFLVDLVTAALAVAVLAFFLHVESHRKALEKEKVSYFHDLSQGVIYIRQHDFLKPFFLFGAVFFFLAAPAALLTPLQVARSFGEDVWRLTAIEIAFSAGMMAGGLLIALWGGFQNKTHTMAAATLLIGLGTVGLGIVPNFWVYLIIMGIVGVTMPMFNTPAMVLLQEKVDADYMGRVFGVMSMIGSTMMPLGMLLFGPISDLVSIEWLLIITGGLIFLGGIWLSNHKILLKAGAKEQTE